TELGFSLHAATHAGAHDPRGREALVKYILRPPLADEHLRLLPDDLVRIQLKPPFRDGTWAVDLDPLSLLSRLAAAVPPPRQHTVRYAGVLAAAAKWRPAIVPQPPAENDRRVDAPPPPPAGPALPPATHRSRYRPFVELLRRTFAIDLETCAHCGARTKVIALVRDPDGIARFLRHLGEPTEPPPLSPALTALLPEPGSAPPPRRSRRALRPVDHRCRRPQRPSTPPSLGGKPNYAPRPARNPAPGDLPRSQAPIKQDVRVREWRARPAHIAYAPPSRSRRSSAPRSRSSRLLARSHPEEAHMFLRSLVTLGAVLLCGPAFARAGDGFAPIPPEQTHGQKTGLEIRVVGYDGSVNGEIAVDVRNPGQRPVEFAARGL